MVNHGTLWKIHGKYRDFNNSQKEDVAQICKQPERTYVNIDVT
jgi:muconolactone delta-isomerase